jgi:hypothetical protein
MMMRRRRTGSEQALKPEASPPASQKLARFRIVEGFTELDRYYRPSGAPPGAQSWLASVWRRG